IDTERATDYTAADETGVAFGTILNATAIDDILAENSETFKITMSNVDVSAYEKVVIGTTEVTTTITDEATPGTEDTVTVKLIACDINGDELSTSEIQEGETAYYKVLATDPDGNEVTEGTVDIAFTDIDTERATDYTAADETGVAFGTILNATAIDDILAENSETFKITMSNV
ncbi:MAG: hypothetical protein GY822_28585, partial [Deltaproteobacteria bacterium]|nr:hypothetical protein [Deltaproteobacteria bacterium]